MKGRGPSPGASTQAPAPGGPHELAAIQLVTTRDGLVHGVDHFMLREIYPLFGAPSRLG